MKAWQVTSFAKKEGGNVEEYEKGEIWIDKVKPDPNQPRKTFDEEELKAFAEGIKKQGLIYPIEIDENNVIIDGERRWRACKMIGMGKIQYKRKVLKDEVKKDPDFRLKRQVQANITGRNLNTDEARVGIETLLRGVTEPHSKDRYRESSLHKLATELGTTTSRLSEILGVAERGSKTLKEKVKDNTIPLSTAYEISKIPTKEVQDEVVEYAEDGELTREQVRDLVKEVKEKTPEEASEIIETHETIKPIVDEAVSIMSKAYDKLKESGELDRQPDSNMANMLFMRGVAEMLNEHKLFCPKCKKSKLKWACCGDDLHSTSDKLEKKFKGDKDA